MAQKQIVAVACGGAIAERGVAAAQYPQIVSGGDRRCQRVPDVMDCGSWFLFQRDKLCQGVTLGVNG
ncbi:hypothetical protein H6F90_24850 [Trichocoleus sp. FACHB-591]|uniref:hypothetical protein n=1 Tax=Trichocoleus sp. FACHB-591 TaxID=2692872 RepID=UPI001683A80D|nr:hypothetical protein [Trichocoleus sp. FACHB-591]MBD2098303.1 hypothetical protein [Trichocoleus sp. FACHB-591]